ncbi:hypothetical protein ISS07_02175 [Candidatus Woesearchaeota archaeon]|nr:hypothetical protein [Candidatus Woesearchaeota archaeon]
MFTKKRGQASIFMVFAIVILLAGSFYFYTQKISLKEITIIDSEAAPVKNFVEECISNVAKQGLTILGANGGYITFPEEIERNKNSYLQTGPISSIKNPYWWHDGIETIPGETFMISQIESYVKENLNSCVNNFAAFTNKFDVKELSDLEVDVSLNENDVTVDVSWKLDLINKLNSTTLKLESFKEIVPIRLKKIYQAARDIYEAEKRDFFLEFKTIDLITLDESIPTTDLEATCTERTWNQDVIESKLKRLLAINLPYINVLGTDFDDNIYVPNPFGEDTYKSSYYNQHYKWQVKDKSYDNLKVSIDYDEKWPFEFTARPSSNGILKSNAQKGQNLLGFLCLHIWHFTYDAVFPVKITITDPDSEQFLFSYALKTSVDHNQPKRENFASTIFEQQDVISNEEYCNDVVDITTISTLSNSTTEEAIDDVELSFTCGIFTCDMGKSEWASFGASAELSKPFPYCVNGILRANKEGFEESQMFINTEGTRDYTIYLKPTKTFESYEIVKHEVDDLSITNKMQEDEIASITLTSTTNEFESFGIIPSEDFPLKLLDQDQEYDLTIHLSDKENVKGMYKTVWKVKKSELQGSNKIIFHIVESGNSESLSENIEQYSNELPKPVII